MKRLLTAFAITAGLALPGSTGAAEPGPFLRTVYLVNASSVPAADVADALPAFQAAVSLDLKRYWGIDARLELMGAAPKGGWTVTLEDFADVPGALGYHDTAGPRAHVPFARVFAADAAAAQVPWQVVLSHELFEMLVDPHVDRAALDGHTFRLVEVADPVIDLSSGYERPGASGAPVPLSDFVTARWYRKGVGGPYDLTRHVRKPLALLPDGYVAWWDGGSWVLTVAGHRAPPRRRLLIYPAP